MLEMLEHLEHLGHLEPGDVLVLIDVATEGYPSHETLHALDEAGVDFLFRVPASNTFNAIDTFRSGGGEDYRVLVHPSKDSPKDSPKDWSAVDLRAVKLTNDNGEESFFLILLFPTDSHSFSVVCRTRINTKSSTRPAWATNDRRCHALVSGTGHSRMCL